MTVDYAASARYAEALFKIAWSDRTDREYEEELFNFSAALKKDPAIEKFLENPSVTFAEKKRFLERVYAGKSGIARIFLDFYLLLIQRRRFYLVHDIARYFKKIADAAQGEGTAEIRTAVPLDVKAEEQIAQNLERLAGYKLQISKIVDPTILGGVVVTMDYKVLDGSVRGSLRRLKDRLTEKSYI